ncbi:extracellular matrix-binding ebh [Babesia caballi]|uniref:Extracellular matrix-binding ebh n=1 Tax=Babesia caballi TaxID=5871 RepID=A0AAV4LND8_BABCB|nr:extracellular matrix-binding ebh [Babesia caballi]
MGEPQKKSKLTTPPTNLREAVDFIAAVGGGFGTTNLPDNNYTKVAVALNSLPGFETVTKETLKISIYDSIIKELAQGLGFKFLGYEGQNDNTFSGTGIIGASKGYISTYAGIDWPSNGDQQTCALIFLGCAVVAYYCLSYFYWRCSESHGKGDWAQQTVGGGGTYLNSFLLAMGYKESLNNSAVGSDVMDKVANELNELSTAAPSSGDYSTFLDGLERQISSRKPINCPLASCFKIAKTYFNSQSNGRQINDAIDKLKKQFEEFSQKFETPRGDALKPNYYEDVKKTIADLLQKASSFKFEETEKFAQGVHRAAGQAGKESEKTAPTTSSPAGPAVGGFVGVGALGAGVAYGLNLAVLPLDIPLSAPVGLSYDCPSNLKEAIDWILRVTGRDGQDQSNQGTQAIQTLSNQVKKLLNQVKDFVPGIKVEEFEKVKNALNNGDLITKLAEGLAKFIGYQTGNNNGVIGVGGIAVSNDPLERLRDGVLMFIAPFLGVLRYHHPELTKDPKLTAPFNKAVEACKNGVGCGREGFEKALAEVQKELGQVKNTPIQQVVNAVKNVSAMKRNQNFLSTFATKVKEYFNNVLQKVAEDQNVKTNASQAKQKIETLNTQLGDLVDNVGSQNDAHPINVGDSSSNGQQSTGLKEHIEKVNGSNGALKGLYTAFPNFNTDKAAYALSAAAYNGVNLFVTVLQTDYTSHYKDATWDQVNSGNDSQTCAKIFLACLPLIFNGLSYIYWECSGQGGWKEMQLNGGDKKGADLKHFMDLMAFSAHWLNAFNEFSTAANGSSPTYAQFLKNLKDKATDYVAAPTTNPLSALFYCSKVYLQCQHIKNAQLANGAPKTIREMLYFLAAMPYSTSYEGLEKHIGDVLKEELDVADSGSSQSGNKLSADQLKEYLTASSAFSSSVLGLIQGPGASEKSEEPWLHELFCNSAFHFKYPSSSSTLFSKVSNYAYALQFQLHFLYQQCSNTYTLGCGWQNSRRVNTTAPRPPNVVPVAVSPPPLQAFLTDNLKGFSRGHPSDPSSHLAECSGPICHVPMGFTANDLRDSSTVGAYIHHVLKPLCGSFNSPLLQLCGTLTCLSKRAPRSLGDLFGFYWQVTGQLFKNKSPTLGELIEKFDKAFDLGNNLKQTFSNDSYVALNLLWNRISKLKFQKPQSQNATVLSRSLESMAPAIPLLYQLFMARDAVSLPVMLFDLKQQCHKVEVQNVGKVSVKHSVNSSSHHNCFSTPADLFSLQTSRCNNGQNCGPYLSPLNHTTGTAFAPIHASSYLSWVIYLAEDLHSRFQEMHDDLKNITCIPSSGSHGPSGSCSCPSVVECAEVLLILHANGFTFASAGLLKNGGGQPSGKKSCQNFHDQLSAVLANDENTPLFKLLTTIDDFLYAIRWEFFSKLSGFWTIYTCLILYTFFFLLDTLHFRSHLKLTASHRFTYSQQAEHWN